MDNKNLCWLRYYGAIILNWYIAEIEFQETPGTCGRRKRFHALSLPILTSIYDTYEVMETCLAKYCSYLLLYRKFVHP